MDFDAVASTIKTIHTALHTFNVTFILKSYLLMV